MFRRKDKSHSHAGAKLGLAISSPITTVKNNSEIIYVSSDANTNFSRMSTSSSSSNSDYGSPNWTAGTGSSSVTSLSSTDGFSKFPSPSPVSGKFPTHVSLSSSYRSHYSIVRPMTPPEEQMEPVEYLSQSPESPIKRSIADSRRPSVQPSIVSKEDDLKFMTYIDLSKSVSTVQMIATTGRLPLWLQRCTNLQYLVAEDLGLSIIDEWVSTYLVNLKVIRLKNNQIATWPDHLSRLVPYGKIKVLDLEGNPCLTNMFKKSSSFKALYIEAALTEDNGNDEHSDLVLKRTRSNVSSSRSSNTTGHQSYLFKNKNSKKLEQSSEGEEEEDEDDDDMLTSLVPKVPALPVLRKHASAGGLHAKFANKNVLVLCKSEHGHNTTSPKKSLATTDDYQKSKVTQNKEFTETDISKTSVILRFLHDVYELTTREHLDKISSSGQSLKRRPSSSGSSSVMSFGPYTPPHSRLHSLDGFSTAPFNPQINMPEFVQRLTEFLEEEKVFVAKMKEMMAVYSTKPKLMKRAEILFNQVPELIHLHEDICLDIFSSSLNRAIHGQDNHLEVFASSVVLAMNSFHRVHVAFAKGCETAKRRARFWIKLRRQNFASTSMYYGGEYTSGVLAQHPECDIGEWLRACATLKKHTLDSILEYLELPLARFEAYKSFFSSVASLFPSLDPVHKRVDLIYHEIQAVLPLEAREARYAELKKLIKMPTTNFGAYLCDSNVVLQSKLSLGEVNIAKGKTGDIMYQAPGTIEKNIPRYAEFDVNDITKPPKGSHFRLIIMEHAVLVVNEAKRNIGRVILKKDIHASSPWEMESMTAKTGGDKQVAVGFSKCLKVSIHDSSEIWYLHLRTFTGDYSGRSLNETRSELINAINYQNNN
ncbi:hypothetical protein AWJ20_3037 [Sugiyamaella lignohabitans]|uniref:DH domain-containing protein n=1 Tax=Sugiyamaella lignohabitans TaxID=796027 RepID=A0A161HHD5_9ASCO|nr:uncharacterized protein AWJ20_3037 [Sugiyamaella lignohabitans]ANB15410.1 hypothetical protein AWJ20_3037 [Sugiyamaella lignohabitans]